MNLQNKSNRLSEWEQPVIGMGATVTMYSDRHAGTIVKITSKTIHVQEDKATRTDTNGMSESQEYTYEPNTKGKVHKFRYSKVYRKWTNKTRDGLLIDIRCEYYDYSF
jgi:hypothetical protein